MVSVGNSRSPVHPAHLDLICIVERLGTTLGEGESVFTVCAVRLTPNTDMFSILPVLIIMSFCVSIGLDSILTNKHSMSRVRASRYSSSFYIGEYRKLLLLIVGHLSHGQGVN